MTPNPARGRPHGDARRFAPCSSSASRTWWSSPRRRNGRQALSLVESETPDVAVMDIAMPILNGDRDHRARSPPNRPELPVVIRGIPLPTMRATSCARSRRAPRRICLKDSAEAEPHPGRARGPGRQIVLQPGGQPHAAGGLVLHSYSSAAKKTATNCSPPPRAARAAPASGRGQIQ